MLAEEIHDLHGNAERAETRNKGNNNSNNKRQRDNERSCQPLDWTTAESFWSQISNAIAHGSVVRAAVRLVAHCSYVHRCCAGMFSLPEVRNRNDPISCLLRHHVAHGQQHGDGDGGDGRVTTEAPGRAPLAPSRRSLPLVSPLHCSALRCAADGGTGGRCGVLVVCDCVLGACGPVSCGERWEERRVGRSLSGGHTASRESASLPLDR